MKIKTLTFIIVAFGLQNSAIAESFAADPAVTYESAASELPSNWGLSEEEAQTVEVPPDYRTGKGYPPRSWNVSEMIQDRKLYPVHSRELRHLSAPRMSRVTFYNPSVNNSMEGGRKNRHGETVNSIEDAAKNGRPVTIAADYLNTFGELCNQKYKRCTLLIKMAGFDIAYPSYRKKFRYLPKNTFIAIVEDTGGAFVNTNGKRFDIASLSKKLQKGIPRYMNQYVKWFRLHNPCGSDDDSRRCNLANAHISPAAVTALATGGRDL
jgi:hypothetical protein